ncbi:MAG: DUF3368 domain-containing protein [Armatimonadetes bacterium]|nr:DUF3368 domain-containing protein [Armatimonadota bacterium]
MADRWVVNASPLIALARVGCAEWLSQLADEVVVPAAVKAEIDAGPADPARQVLSAGLFTIIDAPPPSTAILGWDLGAGETAVLAVVQADPSWTAVLDDRTARRCAASLGARVLGTLSIVVRARQAGLTDSAASVLRAIRANGFRLDDAVIAPFLRTAVGEEWTG